MISTVVPTHRIHLGGIFWLMEYNFEVENHLYSFATVINLLKGMSEKIRLHTYLYSFTSIIYLFKGMLSCPHLYL